MKNDEQLYTDIMQMLPHQLEKVKSLIDNLIEDKSQQKLTNQDYQKKYKEIKCPKCNSECIKKNGTKNNTQRFLCKDCGKSFSLTTNTILENSRINYWQLKNIIKGMLDTKPLSEIALDTRLSKRQVYNIEIKIFDILHNINNNMKLRDVVQVDEKYFRISFKGTRKKKMPRKSRKSGSQDLVSGISNEQVCVIVAIDSYDNIEIKVAGNGPVSIDMISHALKNRIESNSILVTDSKNSYVQFARENNLILKQIPSGKYTVEEIYNLGELNSLMSEIETYVVYQKRGISTRHLQQHLDFLKYKKILKYTIEYLERNEDMFKDIVISTSNLKCRETCNIEMPIDVYSIYGVDFE